VGSGWYTASYDSSGGKFKIVNAGSISKKVRTINARKMNRLLPEQLPKLSFLRRAPTQSRGVRRVLQIVAAAESLLVEIPFDEITIEQIAKRARVTVGTIYFFFSDRTSIYYSLIELEFRRSLAAYELTEQELALPLLEYLPILRKRLAKQWDEHSKASLHLYYAYRSRAPMQKYLDEFYANTQRQMLVKVAAEFGDWPPARQELLARIINYALQNGLDDAPLVTKSQVMPFRREWFAMLSHYIESLQG
jgi:AcrR family transcriptional regulator